MTNPKIKTVKQLFGLSGNKCYFPKCNVDLIDKNSNQVIGEICHIKSRSPGGPRFDEKQSDFERNEFKNLILLCPTHHEVIDSDEESYTVDRLYKIKSDHESKYIETDVLNDELAEKFITKNEIIITTQTNVNTATNSQFASIIQNINPPIESASLISYEDLLEKIYSGLETLSKNLSETLKVAKNKGDNDLTELCITELSGWDSTAKPNIYYRFRPVYLSLDKIERVVNLSMNEFFNDLENKPDQFVRKDMFFANSVPNIESIIEINKSKDPSMFFIHLVKKQGELFPHLEYPELEINIYCRGTLYHDLLHGIKINLANEILKKIK
jgi:hypothetical protein